MNEVLNERLAGRLRDIEDNCPPAFGAPAAWGERLNWARLQLPARAENVAVARAFVAGLIAARPEANWDITVATLEEVKVAVSEAVSNAIIHGYAEDAAQTVRLGVWQYQYALLVQVSDEGVGIPDIARAREPDFTTGQEHLGLGFAFMESFMDDLAVESAPGEGTIVTLTKLFPAEKLGEQA